VVVRRLAGAAVTSIKGGPDQDGLRSRVGPIKTDFDQAWALSRQASIKREPNRTGPDQAWARSRRRLAQAWAVTPIELRADSRRAIVPSMSPSLSRPNSPMRNVEKSSGSPHCRGTPAAICTPASLKLAPLASCGLSVWTTTTLGEANSGEATEGSPR